MDCALVQKGDKGESFLAMRGSVATSFLTIIIALGLACICNISDRVHSSASHLSRDYSYIPNGHQHDYCYYDTAYHGKHSREGDLSEIFFRQKDKGTDVNRKNANQEDDEEMEGENFQKKFKVIQHPSRDISVTVLVAHAVKKLLLALKEDMEDLQKENELDNNFTPVALTQVMWGILHAQSHRQPADLMKMKLPLDIPVARSAGGDLTQTKPHLQALVPLLKVWKDRKGIIVAPAAGVSRQIELQLQEIILRYVNYYFENPKGLATQRDLITLNKALLSFFWKRGMRQLPSSEESPEEVKVTGNTFGTLATEIATVKETLSSLLEELEWQEGDDGGLAEDVILIAPIVSTNYDEASGVFGRFKFFSYGGAGDIPWSGVPQIGLDEAMKTLLRTIVGITHAGIEWCEYILENATCQYLLPLGEYLPAGAVRLFVGQLHKRDTLVVLLLIIQQLVLHKFNNSHLSQDPSVYKNTDRINSNNNKYRHLVQRMRQARAEATGVKFSEEDTFTERDLIKLLRIQVHTNFKNKSKKDETRGKGAAWLYVNDDISACIIRNILHRRVFIDVADAKMTGGHGADLLQEGFWMLDKMLDDDLLEYIYQDYVRKLAEHPSKGSSATSGGRYFVPTKKNFFDEQQMLDTFAAGRLASEMPPYITSFSQRQRSILLPRQPLVVEEPMTAERTRTGVISNLKMSVSRKLSSCSTTATTPTTNTTVLPTSNISAKHISNNRVAFSSLKATPTTTGEDFSISESQLPRFQVIGEKDWNNINGAPQFSDKLCYPYLLSPRHAHFNHDHIGTVAQIHLGSQSGNYTHPPPLKYHAPSLEQWHYGYQDATPYYNNFHTSKDHRQYHNNYSTEQAPSQFCANNRLTMSSLYLNHLSHAASIVISQSPNGSLRYRHNPYGFTPSVMSSRKSLSITRQRSSNPQSHQQTPSSSLENLSLLPSSFASLFCDGNFWNFTKNDYDALSVDASMDNISNVSIDTHSSAVWWKTHFKAVDLPVSSLSEDGLTIWGSQGEKMSSLESLMC